MFRKNPHVGSSFESWLEQEGIRQAVTTDAIKAVIDRQRARNMKRWKITLERKARAFRGAR
jgi:antitoxin HicB